VVQYLLAERVLRGDGDQRSLAFLHLQHCQLQAFARSLACTAMHTVMAVSSQPKGWSGAAVSSQLKGVQDY
jgi:hypothetical protein